jgi:phosphate transport system permease protein
VSTLSIPRARAAAGATIRPPRSRRVREAVIEAGMLGCALLSILVSLGIVFVLVRESLPFFAEIGVFEFALGTRWAPLLEPRSFGVLPLICGTVLVTAIAALVVIPVGSLPTVVYGYFALMFVTPALRLVLPQTEVFNALAAGIVVGIMVLPTVASLSDDAMRAVPRSLRDAAYALGATKHEVTLGIVFPGASSGILSSYLLGISRAIGETMIVAMAAGSTARITANPLESVQTMTGYVVQVSLGDTPAGTVEYRTIFAVGLALFTMTLTMNLISQRVRQRFKRRYG